jgi:sulfhydrogenase subunit delta
VTHTGCGALCPSYDRGCYGCYGPKETPNTCSLSGWLAGLGVGDRDLQRVYRTFNANADGFREKSERHG